MRVCEATREQNHQHEGRVFVTSYWNAFSDSDARVHAHLKGRGMPSLIVCGITARTAGMINCKCSREVRSTAYA